LLLLLGGCGARPSVLPPADVQLGLGIVAGALEPLAGALGGGGNLDGIGGAARFGSPGDLVSDGAGNLYVADTGNHTIRKLVLTTGEVTTIAGSPGMQGEVDGIGAAARLTYPGHLALDGAGNLYIAENFVIRKMVLTTGEVTTLAGAAGVDGSTNDFVGGLAADTAGNLYVADPYQSTIRKVALGTGQVMTFAGAPGMKASVDDVGTNARFAGPYSLALDPSGQALYVSDGHAVRKVVLTTAAVTTVATVDAYNVAPDGAGNVFVTDGDVIDKLDLTTGQVTMVAGAAGIFGYSDGVGTMARFDAAGGMATDVAGNLYVADTFNSVIRKIVPATAHVTTIAGGMPSAGSADGSGSEARFFNPTGVASDGADTLYVADTLNFTIREIALSSGVVSTVAGAAGAGGSTDGVGANARFCAPTGLALTGGHLFIADGEGSLNTAPAPPVLIFSDEVRQLTVANGQVTTLAGANDQAPSIDGIGPAARFQSPFGVAIDGQGNAYVADTGSDTIRKLVTATGEVTTLAGAFGLAGSDDGIGSDARFNAPLGLALDPFGDLYVADTGNNTIRRVVVSSGTVTTIAGSPGVAGSADGFGTAARFAVPAGLALDGAGNLYVADENNATIRKIELRTGAVITWLGVPGQRGVRPGRWPAGLNYPKGVTVLPNGALIITDENAVLMAAHGLGP
jgi:sugar lactone lactonase YvrE